MSVDGPREEEGDIHIDGPSIGGMEGEKEGMTQTDYGCTPGPVDGRIEKGSATYIFFEIFKFLNKKDWLV